ncbi:MAG: hypothetical protein FD144_220 [Rhodospirillaceae bacterium]|nr:MAG: hypothetical protein FD144_220 [Rhodospirillaceae bacterium]
MAARDERITQLRRRRNALGFTRGQIAAGAGISLRDVHLIEKGGGTEAQVAGYEQWLMCMANWSTDQRAAQLERARNGQRFSAIPREGDNS